MRYLKLITSGILSAILFAILLACASPGQRRSSLPPLSEKAMIFVEAMEAPGKLVRVRGVTNLPDGTNLIISLSDEAENGDFRGDAKVVVQKGGFFDGETLGLKAALPKGNYLATVTCPVAKAQPPEVQKVIGERGEFLRGPQVTSNQFGNFVRVQTVVTVSP